MPDRERKAISQVPTSEIVALTRTVARVETKVDTIKDDLLPPVAKAAGEARDGVLGLSARVETLETAPAPVHPCEKKDEIEALEDSTIGHGKALATQGEKVGALSRWRTYLAAILVPLTLAAATAGATAIDRSATNRERAASNAQAIERHEAMIKALERSHAAGRREIIRAVEAVPAKVQLPEPDLDSAVDSAPLNDEERRRIRAILERAEKRNGKAGREP
jgi:hypothetical protein